MDLESLQMTGHNLEGYRCGHVCNLFLTHTDMIFHSKIAKIFAIRLTRTISSLRAPKFKV
jgi:hypothetical protein